MATYKEYYKQMLAAAAQRQEAYERERQSSAEAAAKQVADTYDALDAAAKQDYAQSAAETAAAYRKLYDANAVSEHIARRNAEETMRRMNLQNSGLSRTEQTAISLRRGRADSDATAQKQAAVDKLKAALDARLSENASQSAAKQADIRADAASDVAAYRLSVQEDAEDRAFTLYKQDLAAQNKQNTSSSGSSAGGNGHGGKNDTEKKDNDEATTTPLGGSRFASTNNRSATAVAVNTYFKWREGGDIAAMNYLNAHVIDGYITGAERQKIIDAIGIRFVERVTGEKAIEAVARMDREDARTYLEDLLKMGMILTDDYVAAMKACGLDPWS